MNENQRKLIGRGGIFVGFLLLLAAWVWAGTPKTDPTLPPALSPMAAEEISTLSFEDVMGISTKNTTKTGLQVSDAMSGVMGKRVSWDGYVGRVDECTHRCFVGLWMRPVGLIWYEIDDTIHLKRGKGNHSAQAYFDPGHRALLLKLQIGQKIHVGCTLRSVLSGDTPILEDCNLITVANPEWQEPTPEMLDHATGKPKVVT